MKIYFLFFFNSLISNIYFNFIKNKINYILIILFHLTMFQKVLILGF
jgi:hypothetical protein